ncbi:MAG: hypothetical protein F4213_11235, partial [Boseongicola sp. SB0677_bin_26]|nr:hypothetical protein [Boseongicola sp. SB0677_bin_26]
MKISSETERLAHGFVEANPVFSADEFAEAIDHVFEWRVVLALLHRLAASGRIRESAPEVYVVARNRAPQDPFAVHDCILASKLRADGVLGYHTALELHGSGYAGPYNVVHDHVIHGQRPLPEGRGLRNGSSESP